MWQTTSAAYWFPHRLNEDFNFNTKTKKNNHNGNAQCVNIFFLKEGKIKILIQLSNKILFCYCVNLCTALSLLWCFPFTQNRYSTFTVHVYFHFQIFPINQYLSVFLSTVHMIKSSGTNKNRRVLPLKSAASNTQKVKVVKFTFLDEYHSHCQIN